MNLRTELSIASYYLGWLGSWFWENRRDLFDYAVAFRSVLAGILFTALRDWLFGSRADGYA